MTPYAIEGTFRHRDDKIVGVYRTSDSNPLGTFLGNEEGDHTGISICKHSVTLEGKCGCSACTKRRTQDNRVRTLADLNAANRKAFGSR